MKKHRITILVWDGVVQTVVDIPPDTEIEVRDYAAEDLSEPERQAESKRQDLRVDEFGERYFSTVWM